MIIFKEAKSSDFLVIQKFQRNFLKYSFVTLSSFMFYTLINFTINIILLEEHFLQLFPPNF